LTVTGQNEPPLDFTFSFIYFVLSFFSPFSFLFLLRRGFGNTACYAQGTSVSVRYVFAEWEGETKPALAEVAFSPAQ
jgi:hypothetical protein